MENRKCKFIHSPEIEGQRKKTEATGITRSGILMKKTDKGEFPIVFVEEDKTKQLIEVFANTVQFTD